VGGTEVARRPRFALNGALAPQPFLLRCPAPAPHSAPAMVPVAVAPAAQGMDEGLFGSARRRGREPFNRTRAEGGRVREHARGRGACPLDLPRIKGLALRDRDAPV